MLFFYVRHGDPIYDPDSLTEQGYAQAEALVARMERCAPEKIYVSSSNRAILTAVPTAKKLCKEMEILDWCKEGYAWQEMTVPTEDGGITWGYLDKTMHDFFVSPEVRRLDREWYTHPRFAGTKFEAGIRRIQTCTDQLMLSLGYRHDYERCGYILENPVLDRVALFAHQGFGVAFLSCLLDIPYPQFCTHFDMGHSGVTVIHFSNEEFVVPKMLQLSNDSHIFAKGLPTRYNNGFEF